MFKKLVKASVVAAGAYVVMKVISEKQERESTLRPLTAEEVIGMFNDYGLNILLGYDEKVIHFLSQDKSVAIKCSVTDDLDVHVIEYYGADYLTEALEVVYARNNSFVNTTSQHSFYRLLGRIGVSEQRFLQLINEIVNDPKLADLSI